MPRMSSLFREKQTSRRIGREQFSLLSVESRLPAGANISCNGLSFPLSLGFQRRNFFTKEKTPPQAAGKAPVKTPLPLV